MQIRIGRIIIVSIVVEVIAILGLVLLVALFGPNEPKAAQAYAEEIGFWFGPVAGFVLCIIGAWFVAKQLPSYQIVNGFFLGFTVAIIDVILIIVGGAEFQSIFIVSNLGRLLAGTIGGWLASLNKESMA